MQARRLQGSALLSALFIMTLVAIAATAMSTRLQLDIYRTGLTLTSNKLYLASQAVTFWAMDTLGDNKNKFTIGDTDGKISTFPTKLQRIYPDVFINGALYDMQARFNLNNLQDNKFQPMFLNVLANTLSKSSPEQRKLLLKATQHWISPYQPDRGQDEFLSYYLNQKPGYIPSFQPLKSISEFRLIQGIDTVMYQRLLPYLIALPEKTAININTAPKKLLLSLGNGLTESQLGELMDARGEKGITDTKNLSLLLEKLGIANDHITIESQYFLSIATVSVPDLALTNYTIIKRNKDEKNKVSTSIVYESLNTL